MWIAIRFEEAVEVPPLIDGVLRVGQDVKQNCRVSTAKIRLRCCIYAGSATGLWVRVSSRGFFERGRPSRSSLCRRHIWFCKWPPTHRPGPFEHFSPPRVIDDVAAIRTAPFFCL